MKRFLFIICVLLFYGALPACAHRAVDSGDFVDRSFNHGGLTRTYTAHYPRNQKPNHPLPLVIVLHGAGGAGAESMSRSTGFNAIADREGFTIVYPMGVNGQWNDGRGVVFNKRKDVSHVDDVGFISNIIDQFIASGEADRNRIYITGASNGGMMTYRLGIELSTKLAAIAPVIANIPLNIATVRPARPLSVLVMNGTDDPIIPWSGGEMRKLGRAYGKVLSTEQSVKFWADRNHLSINKGRRQMVPNHIPGDRCQVSVDTYRMPGQEAEVVLYSIIGGGHNVPGSTFPEFKRIVGPKCMKINAAEVIWDFFKRHTLNPV